MDILLARPVYIKDAETALIARILSSGTDVSSNGIIRTRPPDFLKPKHLCRDSVAKYRYFGYFWLL